jgi:uncharacterized protein involved in exopolysaccharide biosynthesis
MVENNHYTPNSQEEDVMEIDLMEYARKLWNARNFLFKVAGIAAIIGIVIAFTTPKQYTVNVKLAPELGNNRRSSSLSSIASMLGVGGMNMGGETDALNVTLYPDVVASTPFIIDLLDTPIQTLNEEEADTTLVEYLKTNKGTLFGTIMSLPGQAIGAVVSLFKDKEEVDSIKVINPFHLTRAEDISVKRLRSLITANVDKKTGVTSLSVTMQDPLVAAIVTDTLLSKLKEHIINYRISKAEEDCNYYEKLYNESKDNYYEAQKAYANYLDANKNIILRSVQIEGERLQNEMNLAYNVYNQMAGQLQMGRAKVQEAKPMFTVVEPATVPLLPSGTGRKMILLGIVFLAVAGASAWILFGQSLWENIKKELCEPKEKEA